MNVSRLPSLIAGFVFAFSAISSAQSSALTASNEGYYTSRARISSANAEATSYRFHKKLPQLFSGYAIEIATSDYPLDRANPVFRQFGNVHYEKLPEGGYSYLILGNFSSKASALHFVNTIIKPKAEDARLFEYKDGNRKVLRD